MGFNLKPINAKIRKNSSSLSLNDLIGGMKEKVSHSNSNDSKNSNLWNDVEYIFVNPANSSPKPKSKKELMIDSCLNDLGIFQVNIGVALKEYKL